MSIVVHKETIAVFSTYCSLFCGRVNYDAIMVLHVGADFGPLTLHFLGKFAK
jgi:hypothetical protein